jgi:hypothetical protein
MPPGRRPYGATDEERSLEGVLGVRTGTEHAPADAPHQRRVPLHQRAEGVRVGAFDERGQQTAVVRVVRRAHPTVQVAQYRLPASLGHRVRSRP